ncbi:hypothetical protein GCM10023093_26350 [Nemorincola caseinilytica]|uniref:Signal transduction histidine kinase internal region domain-containing protein n=1 Tax=Nemorincola caseinilytica TaxID=2054315 RepID=A0ABP8NJV6_9BACT
MICIHCSRAKAILLYTVCILLSLQAAYAQQFPIRNYRMKDGLANSMIFRSYQDQRGFMWFCTNYGISRFDGTSFRNYSSRDGLGANTIMSMSPAGGDSHFISTYGGGLYVLSDTGISAYRVTSGHMPGKIVYATLYHGSVWLISTNATTLYRITNGAVTEVNVKEEGTQPVRFFKMSQCGDRLLLTSSHGLYIADDNGTVHPYLRHLVHEPINDIRQDKNGFLWAGIAGRVLQIADEKIVHQYPISSLLPPGDILVDHNNNIWTAGAEGGIFLIRHGKLSDITPMLNTGDAIVHDLFEDNEGNIWIATGGQGIYQLRSLDMVNYPIEAQKIKSYCRSVSRVSDTEAIIGSIGTISKWVNGRLQPLHMQALTPVAYIYFTHYSNGTIYAGTPYGLVIRDRDGKEKILRSPGDTPLGALSMLIDGDSIWVGSFNSVYRLPMGAHSLDSAHRMFPISRCNAICRSRDGAIQFGTDSGVLRYRHGRLSHTQFSAKTAANAVNMIYEDSRGITWYATDSGLAYQAKNGMEWMTTANGLSHNKCNAIREDKYGTLWVGTAHGLTSIQLGTMHTRNMQTGNFDNEVLSVCCIDSLVFAGMVDGMTVIQQEESIRKPPPPLYITSVRTPAGIQNLPARLDIPYDQNKLLISFTAVSFADPEEIQYRYRIAGLADNWNMTNTKEVDIRALPAGDLTFQVSARLAGGDWGPVVSLPIHVSAPFWRNPWLIAFLLITLSWLIYFITRKLIEQREEKKRLRLALYNRIVYLKQQALSALINPHFIFNCMNSIQHYMHGHDHYMANLYLSDFAQLIRMTLEHSRSAFIPLEQEIARLRLYLSLEQLRFGDELQYQLYIDPAVEALSPRIPNMIVQPYIENAIWHGIMPNKGVGIISIRFVKHSDSELLIEICDNGIGINRSRAANKSGEKRSFGMKLTADRLQVLQQMLGQRFSVSIGETGDKKGAVTGTMVEIVLPLAPYEDRLGMENDTLPAP